MSECVWECEALLNSVENAKSPRIIAIAGPTAVGKTALSIALAKRLNGEIICCDSMQIYRGMDIGTAKPTPEERAQAPHHMTDILPIWQSYSCAEFAIDAERCIQDIVARGKTPILCGGTGLYMESVLYEGKYSSPDSDEDIRRRLGERSREENYEELMRIDPDAARSMHPNNSKRVIRALEIYLLSGKTKTQWDAENRRARLRPGAELYVLFFSERERLYERIDARVDLMMRQGLLEEVRSLVPFPRGSTAAQAIGYKELADYIAGAKELHEAVEEIKKASRNYAKRQLSWWKRNKDAVWVDMLGFESADSAAERIAQGSIPNERP